MDGKGVTSTEGNEVTWLSTLDIMQRWDCGQETVRRRIKRAAVATPKLWGRKNYLRLSDVEAIEAALGVTGIVRHLNRADAS